MDPKIWFTADTHFSSVRTLELSRRPFKSAKHMDEALIANWNAAVGPNDVVYHLGDFGNYEVRERLNGGICLLFGNYERKDDTEGWAHAGFRAVQQEERVYNYIATLVHEPSHMVKGFNLFGHVHQLCMVKKRGFVYGLNVGTDCHFFTPIDVKTVQFYRNAIENHYDEEVFG